MKRLVALLIIGLMFVTSSYGKQKDGSDKFEVTTVTGKKIVIYGTEKGMDIPAYKGKVVND